MKCTILIIVLAIAIGATVLLAGEGVARQDPGGIAFREVVTSEPLLYPASLSAGELSRDGVPGLAVVSADNTASLAYALEAATVALELGGRTKTMTFRLGLCSWPMCTAMGTWTRSAPRREETKST
jgi:hypothetical protein